MGSLQLGVACRPSSASLITRAPCATAAQCSSDGGKPSVSWIAQSKGLASFLPCGSSFRLPERRALGVGKRVSVRALFGGMEALFGKKKPPVIVRETVVPEPDYRIPVVLLGVSAALIGTDNLLAAAPIGLLGLLLLFQTTRVRFVFEDQALELKIGAELEESGENIFVGGKNRWDYSSFLNWELWWPNFPVLVYFKESQTKPEGQVHFFPIIFNGKQLYDVMVERAGPSQTSGPK